MMLEMEMEAEEGAAGDDMLDMLEDDPPEAEEMVDLMPVLGVPIDIHSKLCFNSDPPSLLNLVTGEQVVLPDGDYTIKSDATWFGKSTLVYTADGDALEPVADYFSTLLKIDETTRFLKSIDKETDIAKQLDSVDFKVKVLYVPHRVNGQGQIRLKITVTEWANPKMCCEFRRLWFLLSSNSGGMTRAVSQHWRTYTQWVAAYVDPHLVLRGAYDLKSGLEQHYLRCSDQAGVTTAGVLLLAGHRFKHSRPESKRHLIAVHLNGFLAPFFEDSTYSVMVDPGQTTKPMINSTPATGTFELTINKGNVNLFPLLSAESPCRADLKAALQYAEDLLGSLNSYRLPVGTFALVVFACGSVPLTVEVCSQLAAIVDLMVLKSGEKNPMAIVEDIPSCGVRSRHDRNLLDHLNMGGGLGAAQTLIQKCADHP